MDPKQKKLIIAVVLLVAAAGVYLFFGRTKSSLPDSVKYVCVVTGNTFDISRDNLPASLPAKNPKTGEMTLLPVREKDGKLYADVRYAREALRDGPLAKVNKYVDPQTFEVLSSPR